MCSLWRHVPTLAVGAALIVSGGLTAFGQETAKDDDKPALVLNEHEEAFVELMNNTNLVGTFSIDGRDDRPPRPERYEIKGAVKIAEDSWFIRARVVYGDIDVIVPVPVIMHWAGDTPVLSVTDLAIPLIGEEFSARILFYDNRYAGTWGHGKVGGHMWGKIEKASDADAPTSEPKPE